MFEFEKRILKQEGRFPMVQCFYEVIPIKEPAKLAFSKWNSGDPHSIITSQGERQRIINQYLNDNKEPLIGVIELYDDTEQWEEEVKRCVLRVMAHSGVPNISYNHKGDSFSKSCLQPLQMDKDFKIKIIERIEEEPPVPKLTFDDIKAL